MNYNIVNEVAFNLKKEQINLFDKILERVNKLLDVNERYIFSVILVDKVKIHEINCDYRQSDRETDVISFASLEGEVLDISIEDEVEIGDIFINIDAIQRQADEYGHSFEREFCFLFTHGLLHLLGYDHVIKEDEIKMFSLQDEVLHEIIPR